MTIRNNVPSFSPLDKIQRFPSVNQQEQHICIFDCAFLIPFDQPLVVPSSCRRQLTSNACEIDIELYFDMNITAFIFLNETIDLVIEDFRLNSSSAEIVGYEFENNRISYSFGYKCAIGDECEWNYVKEKLGDLIKTDFQSQYNSLLPLIYDAESQSNAYQCYSQDVLTECPSGICDFTQILDFDNFTLKSIRECLIFDRPKIYFGKYRYTPGPTKYDFDYLYFACNINQCNSPSNEMAIKYLIGFIDKKNCGLIQTSSRFVVLTFGFLISSLMSIV